FVNATTDPWPLPHQVVIRSVGPIVLAAAFLIAGQAPDAVTSVLIGAALAWAAATFSGGTRRITSLMEERDALARDLASLRVIEERSRIARDLHDSLGAELTAVLWQARAL